jgi:integrase
MAGLLARDITTLTGADFAAIIDKLRAKGRAGAADGFRTHTRAFLTWCVTEARVLTVNPLAGHRKERSTRADRIAKAERGRALTDADLKAVWQAADPTTTFGRLIRLYILTGCRRGEGAGLTWQMVDQRNRVLDLPAMFVKQGRGHKVPITPQLANVLQGCIRDARSDLVFPSPRTGEEMNGWSKAVSGLCKASGVDFTLHDLRRTFRTGLSRLGVDVDTAELALGHARADLEATYNRDDALDRLRAAFDKWGRHVEGISAQSHSAQTAYPVVCHAA